MANRSHLYAADTLPTDSGRPDPVVGISEHNWSIPLAHLLLVSFDTRVVPSMIWDGRTGVAGDRLVGEHIPALAAHAEAAIAGRNADWLAVTRGRWRENFYSFYNDTPHRSTSPDVLAARTSPITEP